MYSFEFKINHIARHIRLPDAPVLGPVARALPLEQRPPLFLVINIQLPMYPVRVLAEQDIGGLGAQGSVPSMAAGMAGCPLPWAC